ncbi:MAG: hypothetical protein A3K66_02465 [Euryarchaeota archaeon RBG_16_67_27]|nr:MAG: hypothetical protein A3K66_02465 [Euryarchaeota archaeon RBG_16_67_27]
MESAGVLKAKLCLVGEAAVGKTSLVRRLVEDVFDDRYISTLGSKVSLKRVRIPLTADPSKALEVQLSIWDLIGERTYLNTLHHEYLRGAQGLIAVCDVTRYSTFELLNEWIDAAFRIAGPIPVGIVVNKADLRDQVICMYDDRETQERAVRYGGFATWASAKTGENVNDVFTRLARAIAHRVLLETV